MEGCSRWWERLGQAGPIPSIRVSGGSPNINWVLTIWTPLWPAPLDILKESWEASKHSSESIVSYVLSIQEKLAKMSMLAWENLTKAQAQQKCWYDRNAREREFQREWTCLSLATHVDPQIAGEMAGTLPSKTSCQSCYIQSWYVWQTKVPLGVPC